MKLGRILTLLLVCALLAGCGGAVGQEDLTGCWYMGQDLEYRYLVRFSGDGSFEILQTLRHDPTPETAVVFRLPGNYTLEDGVLTRNYETEIAPDSALALPAELELNKNALILSYGGLTESWPRLTEEAEALCLGQAPAVECENCGGLGILGHRDDLPIWCRDCCGLGIVNAK